VNKAPASIMAGLDITGSPVFKFLDLPLIDIEIKNNPTHPHEIQLTINTLCQYNYVL
jgi:hypothetical protein